MKKEEAEALLDRGDLGPIEDYVEAVATEWRLPGYAIGISNRASSLPGLTRQSITLAKPWFDGCTGQARA